MVTAARREDDGGFRVALDDGREVSARRLLVATGLVDELPDVPGLAERWGRDVLHCPYCHGWEVRDQAIGVLATGPIAVHQALLFRQLSDDVVFFRHTGAGARGRGGRAARRPRRPVVRRRGGRAGGDRRRLTGVRLASGEVVPRAALVVAPRFTARAGVLAVLGPGRRSQEMRGARRRQRRAADPTGATAVPGVWVAGNVADLTRAGGRRRRRRAAGRRDDQRRPRRRGHPARRRPRTGAWRHERGRPGVVRRALPRGAGGVERPPEPAARRRGEPTCRPARRWTPGRGEGGDALWLAERGWRVTAVDFSTVALERAAAHGRRAGARRPDRVAARRPRTRGRRRRAASTW